MPEAVEGREEPDDAENEGGGLREDLYEQFDVTDFDRLMIVALTSMLELSLQTESRYDVDERSEILAQIALYQAYERSPKLKFFAWVTTFIVGFDLLYPLSPGIYGIYFIAFATVNGFLSTFRAPLRMAAELEGAVDEDGMPADYRARALTSVNTNITLVLFAIGVVFQVLVSGGHVQGEIVTRNVAGGRVNPIISGIVLLSLPIIYNRIR
ncbi:hypothetical protein [Halobacterium sp. KA-6]|uniref:hypothetical protein n=1 Tax=Halobacterium sp. KA-6 TaxID=2896368 RepID=UPI001E2E922D|nr:hypothetical protein [Halobacterium sp. KA-6]MCD2204511.1 hypothetical protein [Halobacterium sp. KA-6]